MIEDCPPRVGQTFRFVSGKPGFGALILGGFIAVFAIATLSTGNLATTATPGNAAGTAVVILFFAYILFASVTRVSIVEIDMATRRLRIFRRSFGRWTKTIVDCPLDQCTAFGTIEYDTDGRISYGAYVQLSNGRQHAIPAADSSFKEAARVASQLSAATGIPRLDTKFP